MKKMTPEELEQFIHRELRALPPRQAPAGFEARLQAAVEARGARPDLSPEQLEQLIGRELRALPLRRAPRSLESRVQAALESRALIPWYHKSWSHWPAAIRAVFLTVATSVTGAAVIAFSLVWHGGSTSALAREFTGRISGLSRVYQVIAWMVDLMRHVVGSIPPVWLYGGLVTLAALYATFFGLGAAAYQTVQRKN